MRERPLCTVFDAQFQELACEVLEDAEAEGDVFPEQPSVDVGTEAAG